MTIVVSGSDLVRSQIRRSFGVKIIQGDRTRNIKTMMRGPYDGVQGVQEWIVPRGALTHQLFRPYR